MNISLTKIRDWVFDKAYKTQKESSFKVIWIPLLIYIAISILLLHVLNNFCSNLSIVVFGVLAILFILWYLLSWPLYLIDEMKNPRDIPDTQPHYEAAEKIELPLSSKEKAEYEIEYMEGLVYSLKRRMFRTVLRIIVVFVFIIFIFGGIFKAVDRLCCPNSCFYGIEKNGSLPKYVYYSLVTFTTVGFGDIYPEGMDPWRYATTAFEIATATAYVVLSLTMVVSCIFVQYSIRKEHFSLFLNTVHSSS